MPIIEASEALFMEIMELLKDHVPFLSGLTEEEMNTLASNAQKVTFKAGQTILMQGETVDDLHLISKGKVAVLIRQQPKQPPVQVAELGPGKVFGETSIVEEGVAGATIKALEETVIFTISEYAFRDLLEKNIELKERIIAHIEFRKRQSQHKTDPN